MTYQPGKPYLVDKSFLVSLPILSNTKRILGADEFAYYHDFLKGKLSDPIKAGIAVVLMADLKRWAGVHTLLVEDFLSPEIIKYVDVFTSLPESSIEKVLAREEIKNFDLFLMRSTLANRGRLHLAIEEARKGFTVRLAVSKREREKASTVEGILEKEKEAIELKEFEAQSRQEALIIAKSIETHMRSKIREFLAATYEESMGKLFMDPKNSEIEFKVRMDLVKRVQNNSLHPIEAIADYKKKIDLIAEFYMTGKGNALMEGPIAHPMSYMVGQK